MKLLILGRDGQIGWELQRALVPLGEVVALSRAQADLEDTEALIGAVAAERPDILVNAAAYTAVDKAESEPGRADRVNRAAVEALAGWAAASNCWLVHYSTDYVFDGRKTSPYVETDEAAPQSAYGRSKRAGEMAILASGCRHLIFRTSWVHAARGTNFVRTISASGKRAGRAANRCRSMRRADRGGPRRRRDGDRDRRRCEAR